MPRICDYEGSQYRAEFWENKNRRYEDLAERIAIRKMLPPQGGRLIEVGAGFGRLVDLYEGYQQVVLMDYARSQLEEAQRYLGNDNRFIFVVAEVYNMPFVDHLFDTLVMVRVMHHLADVPTAVQEIHRIINPEGKAVIEHANKRHLKSVLRWLLRRQDWNPFGHEPHEFVELNIDFHPTWMRQQFISAGFAIRAVRTVSHYRLPWLKDRLPAPFLAALDGFMQPTGRWFQYAPSVFLEVTPDKPAVAEVTGFFRCPACGNANLQQFETILTCSNCHSRWECRESIYDFKTPLNS